MSNNRIKHLYSLLAAWVLLAAPLAAEIEHVIVTWSGLQCQQSCINQLTAQFKSIPGVAEVSMGPGQVTLKWKPNVSFSFAPINTAMSLIGLSINDIRVKATGTITHNSYAVTLISSGDNTRFDLLNPVVPDIRDNRQAPQFNIGARGLRPELKQQLLQAESEGKIATISGPLLKVAKRPHLSCRRIRSRPRRPGYL